MTHPDLNTPLSGEDVARLEPGDELESVTDAYRWRPRGTLCIVRSPVQIGEDAHIHYHGIRPDGTPTIASAGDPETFIFVRRPSDPAFRIAPSPTPEDRPSEGVGEAVERVGPWRIWFDPPPIGTRICDWHYQHEDTDLECPAWMNGSEPSRDACLTQIIEGYEDRIEALTAQVAEMREGLRVGLTALDRVFYEWDGEPEDMDHVIEAKTLLRSLTGEQPHAR